MLNLPEILKIFRKGYKPKEEEFRETWRSFWHKSERLPLSQVLGLANKFEEIYNTTASKEDLASVAVGGLNPMGDVELFEELASKPKRDKDSYFVKDRLDPNGDPYIFKYDAGLDEWINTKQVVYQDVARKSDVTATRIEANFGASTPDNFGDKIGNQIETVFEDGLLSLNGRISIQHEGYLTSGFIELPIDRTPFLIRKDLKYLPDAKWYKLISFYENASENGFITDLTHLDIADNSQIKFPSNAKFIRYSKTKDADSSCGLYKINRQSFYNYNRLLTNSIEMNVSQNDMLNMLNNYEREVLPLTPIAGWYRANNTISDPDKNSFMHIKMQYADYVNDRLLYTGRLANIYFSGIMYFAADGSVIKSELVDREGTSKHIYDYPVKPPIDTDYIVFNCLTMGDASKLKISRLTTNVKMLNNATLVISNEDLETLPLTPIAGWYRANNTISDPDKDAYMHIKIQYGEYKRYPLYCSTRLENLYFYGIMYFAANGSVIKSELVDKEGTAKYIYDYLVNPPIDTDYIVFNCRANGDASKLQIKQRKNTELATPSYVNKCISEIRPFSYWNDKNIWWCGTSIPAGGFWDVNNKKNYPYITGSILGANRVFNEAVGSSQANGSMNISTYEVISRRMGHTIEQKLQILDDLWVIDDANKTFSVGVRTMGITNVPNYSSYEDIVWQRYLLLSHSYEIKLIAKYLLKDKTDHTNFLKERFGDRYNAILSNSLWGVYNYQGDIDLFVFDHSNNDASGSYTDINSTDITTYVGALNTYVRLIQQYKPKARIVFVSNYVDEPTGTIKTLGDIANNWNMPFIDLTKSLPFNTKFKILTRGYWDSDSIWHDEGFDWSDDGTTYTTNLNLKGMSNRVKGDLSLTQVKANINPQLINGIWYWEGFQRDIWIRDGLHPHTDASLNLLKMYAQTLAGWLNSVGNGYIA